MKLRHELKFYIHYHEYVALRHRISSVLEKDPHSIDDEGYEIRSLYYDDIYDSALMHKNSGVLLRNKYRIRIYNRSDAVIQLERKRKFGDLINKESAPLTREQTDRLLVGDTDFLAKLDHPLLQDFHQQIKLHRLIPKSIVDYKREAYKLDLSEVRVTFDKDLRGNISSLDLFDPNLATMDAFQQPILVMEVKYNEFLPEFVRRALQITSHQRSAISKYVICREIAKLYYSH